MLNLEIQMETNRTSGSLYPGRARQADRWLLARLKPLRGSGLTARLDRDRTWRVEIDGEGGTIVLTGTTGTNAVTHAFIANAKEAAKVA